MSYIFQFYNKNEGPYINIVALTDDLTSNEHMVQVKIKRGTLGTHEYRVFSISASQGNVKDGYPSLR